MKKEDMEITAKELRGKPGQIIEQAARGTDIIITIHGKRLARLVPYKAKDTEGEKESDEIFGLWSNRKDQKSVDEYVREKRKGRSF